MALAVPDELDGVTLALALIGVGIGGAEGVHELLVIHAEHHAVDRLELQRVVVVVHHLYQGVTGGQRQILLGGLALLLLLIAGLGGGQRVVAIAHGEQQRRHAGDVVLLLHGLVGGQALQRVGHGVDLLVGQLEAADVTAVLHQVEVIDLLHTAGSGGQRLDDGLFGVVDEQHDVGQLDGGVAAHLGPGRDAVQHRALGGADQRARAGGKVISVQVHHADKAVADLAVGLLALDIDQAVGQRFKHAVGQVLAHGGVDVSDQLVHIGGFQIGFRQDQAQRGGGVAHLLLHRLPVLRLRGKLVAGHHGPLGHILALGQQDVGGIKAQLLKLLVHGLLLIFLSFRGTYEFNYGHHTKNRRCLQCVFQNCSGNQKNFCAYHRRSGTSYDRKQFSARRL